MLSEKQSIGDQFKECRNTEEIYHKIIAHAKKLPPFDPAWKQETNRVSGCQSLMYLYSEIREGKIYFSAFSEALISAGLAALLIHFYNGRTPEEVLTTPPSFLDELNISNTLTPGRANGLSSLYLHMKRAALYHLRKLMTQSQLG